MESHLSKATRSMDWGREEGVRAVTTGQARRTSANPDLSMSGAVRDRGQESPSMRTSVQASTEDGPAPVSEGQWLSE